MDDGWDPKKIKGSLFQPKKMKLTDKDISKQIERNEELEEKFYEQYSAWKQPSDMKSSSASIPVPKPTDSNNNKASSTTKKPNSNSKTKSTDPAREEDFQLPQENSDEEDIPREAREWKAQYMKDDMEILYDPVEDLRTAEWIDRNLKHEDRNCSECLNCPGCFVPLTYSFETLHLYSWKDCKQPVKGVKKEMKYMCKEVLTARVDLSSVEETKIGENWKILKLEDETFKDYTELVFNVECEQCEAYIGEFLSTLEIYLLDNCVIEGNS